ncbi:MAG: sigma-70 family RNA polymerase sigma factor [Bacteroidota bacterium]|nr:sigma-70 family RNA polymerase sigma factor [Bacteroidota bacterium]
MKTTDNEIIRRVIDGDQRAYAELVERHKDKAMTLAMRMLKNKSEAEEALQDAFVRAYKALPSFEKKSTFATWFYRIVFNVCSSVLNKRGSNNLLSIDIENDGELKIEIPSEDDEPDIELESKEFSEIVRREISTMEESYSMILTMFFLQEMSYEEIISVTGLPLGTVKNRLFRARTQLRSAVLRHFSEMKQMVNV